MPAAWALEQGGLQFVVQAAVARSGHHQALHALRLQRLHDGTAGTRMVHDDFNAGHGARTGQAGHAVGGGLRATRLGLRPVAQRQP